MLSLDLSGKTALVTGATGDLGRVMVRTLAACGAHVVIHYHTNQVMAEKLLGEVQAIYTQQKRSAQTMIVSADITVDSSVAAMRDQVVKAMGAPDIVVNNAVIQYKWVSVLEQDLKDYESQFRSCVLHNVLMAKAFVPAMIAKKWGRVIAISTECAMQCAAGQSAYVSGKRGMDGVIRALAREVGMHNITVNQVAPGYTISDRDRAAGSQINEAYSKSVPLGHRGTDQDIANAVAFLASDLAAFITGAYIPVCGGNVMPTI